MSGLGRSGLSGDAAKADLELVRVAVSPEGAFGVILIDGVPAGPVSCERTYPVAASAPRGAQLVKIPAGRWVCKRTHFNRGNYPTYEITGVPGHSRLLFHAGNTEDDSDGCVLVGQRFGFVGARPSVLQSRLGFAEFMNLTFQRQRFILEVRGA